MVAGAVWAVGCSGGSESGHGPFCNLARDGDLVDDVASRIDPVDVERTRAAFDDMASHQRELLEVAPEELRADLERVVAFTEEVVAGLSAVSPLDRGRPAVFDRLQPEYPAVAEASTRLAAWVDAECPVAEPGPG